MVVTCRRRGGVTVGASGHGVDGGTRARSDGAPSSPFARASRSAARRSWSAMWRDPVTARSRREARTRPRDRIRPWSPSTTTVRPSSASSRATSRTGSMAVRRSLPSGRASSPSRRTVRVDPDPVTRPVSRRPGSSSARGVSTVRVRSASTRRRAASGAAGAVGGAAMALMPSRRCRRRAPRS
ncbi:hypothetical protein [Ornithinimicrobium kibberense]|uniref:hypothetical protein n=1 Tax=Ornithinimicrobium kibberense TaxID=282060 RepID=UPI00360DBEE3